METDLTIECLKCGKSFTIQKETYLNVGDKPELKEDVLCGKLFIKECPHCGTRQLVKYPLIYMDKAEKLLICLSDSNSIHIEETGDLTCRLVSNIGDLIEKIKIFDAGLDDIAIEMCKFVTLQELQRQVELKFLKIDGSEGDMIFTYPEKGEMQMLSVGINVYEDCRRIIERNPSISQSATGLAKIDRDYLATFLA